MRACPNVSIKRPARKPKWYHSRIYLCNPTAPRLISPVSDFGWLNKIETQFKKSILIVRRTVGFGGPVALVGYMHRDLVERKKWISESEFKEGMTLAQLMPGHRYYHNQRL